MRDLRAKLDTLFRRSPGAREAFERVLLERFNKALGELSPEARARYETLKAKAEEAGRPLIEPITAK